MSDAPQISAPAQNRMSARMTFARLLLAVLLGGGGTLLIILVVMMWRRGSMEPLTAERIAAAESRWAEDGPQNYDVEVSVTGRQSAVYRVEVRHGEAQRATRNGDRLSQRRTLDTWSVPGMFATIHEDRKNLERVAAGDKSIPALTVLIEFDEQYGYPKRYMRIESAAMGAANPEVSWQVTAFEKK